MPSAGLMAIGAAGGAVLVVALVDIFITIFNYDGFNFLTRRAHRVMWALLRTASRPLPVRARDATLSLGSAAMLPSTLAGWLTLEISGFAMMYLPGLAAGSFTLSDHVRPEIGSAFYLSAGSITSLTFGDILARTGPYQALVDLETVIGLATFTLALTYVLTAFDALGSLNTLHGRVRRQAMEPNRPSSIVARYFRGGQPQDISTLLGSLTEDLDNYEQGLRRYPVVFYFHTRRVERSLPRIFATLGDVVELLRWGLSPEHSLTDDPALLALASGYADTVLRLQRSFVGDDVLEEIEPLPEEEFWCCFDGGGDDYVTAFHDLRHEASEAAGLPLPTRATSPSAYQRYREWLPFHHRRRRFIDQLTSALGYSHDTR